MKEYSISRRLTVSLIATVAVVAIAAISSIHLNANRQAKRELENKADEVLQYLTGSLEIPLWLINDETVTAIGKSIAQNELVVKLIIKDNLGTIIYFEEKEHSQDLINGSSKIFHNNEFIGEIEISLTKRFYQENSQKLLLSFAIITVFILASLVLVTGFYIRAFLKKPLNSLNKIVDSYAAGVYDSPVARLPYLEFQPVGKILAQMGEKIKEQFDELYKAKEVSETASRSKSDFLARMSHEIRTPLNAVTGLTNIVLKSELSAEQRDYLNKVQIASDNLLAVINDILDFSKVEAGRLELKQQPFDLDQVLEQLADLFKDQMVKKDLELIFTVAPDVSRQLAGDAERLTQVLTNLVANAVKFTHTGEIVVGVELDDQADQRTQKAALKFRVSDTGTGIAADVLPTLFEPFTQLEGYLTRKHEGTGLGLAICKRLVELMGGRIWGESTPGRGSTFSFTVLLETPKEEKPRLSLPADLLGLKTLVVDDSATARQVLCDLLESFTFNVSAVDSGEKAIEALRRAASGEPYQLVLLDWKMPGMDGIETARRIRAIQSIVQPETIATDNRSPSVSPPIIILVTAYGREQVQAHMDKEAVNTMLLKPVKPSQLFNTIMELFGQKEVAMPRRTLEPVVRPIHRLAGRRVLVVEDSALNRIVAMALLEEAGLMVEVAENGQVAVDKVTESPKGYYDAVLMDIQMPVIDGYEATRRIREWEANAQFTSHRSPTNDHRILIIAFTAHAIKGEKEKCLAAGMDDYLSKPFDEQDLYRVLLKWISSQQKEVDISNRL